MAENKYVFISYSSKDIEYVNQITEAMDNAGIMYWKAPENIPAGSNYAREIPKAINDCDIFLLVVSKTSQGSIWVEKELDTAICARKKIIPIHVDNEPLSDMYRFYLNNVQMFEARIQDERIDNVLPMLDVVVEFLSEATDDGGRNEVIEANVTSKRVRDKRSNALRINRIPLECEFCGGEVEQISMGIYKCLGCGRENYDDFQKVRNYLEKVGSAPVALIARNTGVPAKTIEYFWREEFLEIPSAVAVRLSCLMCGRPIRSGSFCDACKTLTDRTGFSSRRRL